MVKANEEFIVWRRINDNKITFSNEIYENMFLPVNTARSYDLIVVPAKDIS